MTGDGDIEGGRPMGRIGVSLSGGGHRAALFGLGALMYLVDAGLNRDVVAVASVSGGSITNGFLAQSGELADTKPEDFDRKIQPLVHCIAQQGTVLPPSPLTLAYLIVLAALALGTLVGVWFIPVPVGVRVVIFFAGLVVVGFVARLRGGVAARAFASRLFSPTGRPTALASVARTVDHVICAADLHAGENVYFSGRFVSSYRYGWGTPGDLPLHLAVQASSALPGPFPARWLRVSRHQFRSPLKETEGTRYMVLADGGVYDNMADQWFLGMPNRRERFGDLAEDVDDVDQLIVVNSSGGLGWGKIGWLMRFPLVGELLSLMRDSSVLYDNGNSVRRELLIERFGRREQTGRGLLGALVHIPRSPLYIPGRYEKSQDPGYSARARAMLDLLTPERARWERLTDEASGTKTSLTRLGTKQAADLLEHGYVLAMANLHVILGFPKLDLPDRERFDVLPS